MFLKIQKLAEIELAEVEIGRSRDWPKSIGRTRKKTGRSRSRSGGGPKGGWGEPEGWVGGARRVGEVQVIKNHFNQKTTSHKNNIDRVCVKASRAQKGRLRVQRWVFRGLGFRVEGTDFGQSRFGHPDLTDFGQSNFGQIQFWPIQFCVLCCVVVFVVICCCGSCWWCGCWFGPPSTGPPQDPPPPDSPKFRSFFSLSRHNFFHPK